MNILNIRRTFNMNRLMFDTIEGTNSKMMDKVRGARLAISGLREVVSEITTSLKDRPGKKYKDAIFMLDNLRLNLITDSLHEFTNCYSLSIISVLGDYYSGEDENAKTREFYRIITCDNFVSRINDLIHQIKSAIGIVNHVLHTRLFVKQETRLFEYRIDEIMNNIEYILGININIVLEKRNFEVCKCGTRMTVVPELSEMHCPSPACGKVKTIIGAVFRDDQFYPQEGQKTKHGGYDTSRHYRFWIERLQALETKTFDDNDLEKIEYVLSRDGYDRRTLTCEHIRDVLKDSKVGATHLNDHAPLLVKTFGGAAPPRLNFQENKIVSMRFNKAMRLYDIVNPEGGNKPYYPYFIYKIIEHEFRDSPDKLRLLDYIHLQSRETIIKNDKFYEQICAISDPEDGLAYSATDPCGRI